MKLEFKNNFPIKLRKSVVISEERPKKTKGVSWIPAMMSKCEIVARIATILFTESWRRECYPRYSQTEARAYFVSELLLEFALNKLNVEIDLKKSLYVLKNYSPKFTINVFFGNPDEVEKFIKKKNIRVWKKHYASDCPKDKNFGGITFNGIINGEVINVAIKTATKKGPRKPEETVALLVHEMVHAVEYYGQDHSRMDPSSLGKLYESVLTEMLKKINLSIVDLEEN